MKGFTDFKRFLFVCLFVLVHVEDIVTAVFQYLAMLRVEGPKEWIFQECSVSLWLE